MNATQLKSRAARLMARLTAMGFTKAGKPMVIDQAFELVAAEEGYRNQHALRASLPKVTGIDAAVAIFARGAASAGYQLGGEPVVAEDQAEDAGLLQWHAACNRAAWNDEAQILQMAGFIAQKGLMAEFGAYAAAVEDAPAQALCVLTAEHIAFLQASGYVLEQSAFKRPYWERGDDASEDFETDEAAWRDAWKDAFSKGLITTEEAQSPMRLNMATLEARWGHEHFWYARAEWRHDVGDDNTRLGYWEWVAHNIESHGGEKNHCCECGCTLSEAGDARDPQDTKCAACLK